MAGELVPHVILVDLSGAELSGLQVHRRCRMLVKKSKECRPFVSWASQILLSHAVSGFRLFHRPGHEVDVDGSEGKGYEQMSYGLDAETSRRGPLWREEQNNSSSAQSLS